jgi:hypothetical protein
MGKGSVILFLIFIAIIIGAAYYLVNTLQETQNAIDGAVAPFRDSNAALQTQVSVLMNPTPTIIPDPATYIRDIQALARLETIQYSVEKVITAEIGQGSFDFLFGDKLLFVAHGIVIAGVDMAKMTPQDMAFQNGILYMRLPPAEVFIATLDNERSYVYTRETGFLTKQTVDLETLARQRAEEEIKKAAVEDGILNLAQQNAEVFLDKFFEALGFNDVQFVR